MDQDSTWSVVKVIAQYAVAPLAGVVMWIYKQQHARVDSLEQRMVAAETELATFKVMLDMIRDDIKEIKHGVEKLVDRQWHKK